MACRWYMDRQEEEKTEVVVVVEDQVGRISKGEKGRKIAYQTTGVIVVQLDQSLDVAAFSIRSVHEVSRLLEAEFHVVAATSPLPVTLGRQTLLHFDGAAQFGELITCAICVIRENIQKLSLLEMMGK